MTIITNIYVSLYRSDEKESYSRGIIDQIINHHLINEDSKEVRLDQEGVLNIAIEEKNEYRLANAGDVFISVSSLPNRVRHNSSGCVRWFWALLLLTWRSSVEVVRDKPSVTIKIGTQLFFGVIVALIYNLLRNQAGVQNRQGLLFFITINQVHSDIVSNSFITLNDYHVISLNVGFLCFTRSH